MTDQCGTPAYIAPEILRDKGYEGFASDIWSAGIVLYAMLYGSVPFKANNMNDLHQIIIKGKYSLKNEISKEAQEFIKMMLEVDPKKRGVVGDLMGHEWLKDVPE